MHWRPVELILHICIMALDITHEKDVCLWIGDQKIKRQICCTLIHKWQKENNKRAHSQKNVKIILHKWINEIQMKEVICNIDPKSDVIFDKYKCQNYFAHMHKWHSKKTFQCQFWKKKYNISTWSTKVKSFLKRKFFLSII